LKLGEIFRINMEMRLKERTEGNNVFVLFFVTGYLDNLDM